MITGFNTDIENEGKVFHVQTEDKGVANPIIETLVYTGGQIVCARKTSYAELASAGELDEEVIHARMEAQHRDLIRERGVVIPEFGRLEPGAESGHVHRDHPIGKASCGFHLGGREPASEVMVDGSDPLLGAEPDHLHPQ